MTIEKYLRDVKHFVDFSLGKHIDKAAVLAYKANLENDMLWQMKSLCEQAGVSLDKVFPHNLRYFFVRTFYGIEKDIAKLADILGHSSINTTRIYIITTGVEHRRKMDIIKNHHKKWR